MSRKQLERQIELLQQDVVRQSSLNIKFYQGFNILMEHFNELPDDIKPKLDDKLKSLGL